MSYSKLIHEYLDSQLNAVNEDVLFAELAKNPDLRVEFNQQVQLQNVAMSDMRTISPPAESTNAIFTSLGFSIPSGDYLRRIAPNPEAGISIRPVGTTVSRFIKKHSATVAAVIITASLTTAVFMLTDNRFAAPSADENIAQVQNEIPVVSSQEKDDIATVKQSNLTNNTTRTQRTVATVSERTSNSTPIEDDRTNLASLFNSSPSVKTNNSHENINLMGTNGNHSQGFVSNEIYDPFFSALNIEPAKNFNDGNLAFIVTYSNQQSDISVEAPGQSFAGNNFNVTALYKINDNWYVGGSVGAEQFALDYNLSSNGESYQYQQLPSFKYLGFTAKGVLPLREYFEYGDILTPYVQLFGGTTLDGWFLGKVQGGITLATYNKFAINIGYEHSTFIYKVGDIKTSSKNGMIIGMGLSF